MNDYVKLSMDVFKLDPLHYVSLPGFSFGYWLQSIGTILDTLQDKQMLDDFIEAKRGGICGIKGGRIVNTSESNNPIWYIDANNLHGDGMMQKLPYKHFKYSKTSLDKILITPDDNDFGYYIICDIDYIDDCKIKTEQLPPIPN